MVSGVNQPNNKVKIHINERGVGKLLVKGAHFLEIEMLRMVHGHTGTPTAHDAGPNQAHIQVLGEPDSDVEVEFHASARAMGLDPSSGNPEVDYTKESTPIIVEPDQASVEQPVEEPTSESPATEPNADAKTEDEDKDGSDAKGKGNK